MSEVCTKCGEIIECPECHPEPPAKVPEGTLTREQIDEYRSAMLAGLHPCTITHIHALCDLALRGLSTPLSADTAKVVREAIQNCENDRERLLGDGFLGDAISEANRKALRLLDANPGKQEALREAADRLAEASQEVTEQRLNGEGAVLVDSAAYYALDKALAAYSAAKKEAGL